MDEDTKEATPHEVLMRELMDHSIGKTELMWAAMREIDTLRAELKEAEGAVADLMENDDKLRAEVEQYKRAETFNPPVTCIDNCSDVVRLQAENQRLRDALKVFADLGDEFAQQALSE